MTEGKRNHFIKEIEMFPYMENGEYGIRSFCGKRITNFAYGRERHLGREKACNYKFW